jgi:hypothetical protein
MGKVTDAGCGLPIAKILKCDNTDFNPVTDRVATCADIPVVTPVPLFATPAQTIAGTATNLIVNPADLYARENIAAQTGLSNNLASIPAPAANQSNWGVNLLGETLHYMPGVGWKIVADLKGFTQAAYTQIPINTLNNSLNIITPRAGRLTVSAYISALLNGTPAIPKSVFVAINKGSIRFADKAESTTADASDASASGTFDVLAGDVINIVYWNNNGGGAASTLYSWQYQS